MNESEGTADFYMKPNGVFYVTRDNKAAICATEDFPESKDVKYATQSGPMLVINGERRPQFTKGSTNAFVRNGVGTLPDGRALFVMSKKKSTCMISSVSFWRKAVKAPCTSTVMFREPICRGKIGSLRTVNWELS